MGQKIGVSFKRRYVKPLLTDVQPLYDIATIKPAPNVFA